MRTSGIWIIVSLLVISLLLGGFGCASPGPTPAPSPSTTTPKYTWRVQTVLGPPIHTGYQSMDYWAKAIAKYSNGQIAVQLYPSMGLSVAGPDIISAIGSGQIDAAENYDAYVGGKFPVLAIRNNFRVPFDTKILQELGTVLRPLYDEVLAAQNNKLLYNMSAPPLAFFIKKTISSWTDMRGLKIRSSGVAHDMLFKALGIEPISMAAAEVQQAVIVGTLDGFLTDWVSGPMAMKATEITKYVLDSRLVAAEGFIAVNKTKFDALPADLQQAVLKASEDSYKEYWNILNQNLELGTKKAKDAGMIFVPWPKEAQDRAAIAGKDQLDYWKKNTDPKYYSWWDKVDAVLKKYGY